MSPPPQYQPRDEAHSDLRLPSPATLQLSFDLAVEQQQSFLRDLNALPPLVPSHASAARSEAGEQATATHAGTRTPIKREGESVQPSVKISPSDLPLATMTLDPCSADRTPDAYDERGR